MPARPSRIHRALHIGIARLVTIACILAISGLACNSATPAIPTVPPLTAPPPATPTPTPPGAAPTETAAHTPSPSSTETSQPPPSPVPTAVSNPPGVSEAVVTRTAEQTEDLTDRMLQPRQVDPDFLWGMFMTNRLFVGGWGRTPDPNYTTQMLEMWHSENPCYSALESEVVKLGGESNLPPLEFLQYMEHLNAQLSPCIEDQLQSISGLQFFDNAPTVRNQRITMWFDRTWEDADDGTFPFADDCRTRFYSHLPEAIAAGDPPHLESAWASAMAIVSGCARDAMRDYFAFLDISEPQLKQLPPDDRYTAVSLQMTMIGHLLAVDLRKPSDGCWPDYANQIPQVAATTDPDEMIAARNSALRFLQTCLQETPASNPFSER